jgi:hypothetical protein
MMLKVKGAPLRVDWKHQPTLHGQQQTSLQSIIGSLLAMLARFTTFHWTLSTRPCGSTSHSGQCLSLTGNKRGFSCNLGSTTRFCSSPTQHPRWGLAYYHINVRKDAGSPLVPCTLITFTNSSTINLTGWLKSRWWRVLPHSTQQCLQSPQLVSLFRKNSPYCVFHKDLKNVFKRNQT